MRIGDVQLADELIAQMIGQKVARLEASDANKFMQLFGGSAIPISKDYVNLEIPKDFYKGLACQFDLDPFSKYSPETMALLADAWSAYQEGACPRLFSITPPLDGDLPYSNLDELFQLIKENKGSSIKIFSVTGSYTWLIGLKHRLISKGLKYWDDFIIFKMSETKLETI